MRGAVQALVRALSWGSDRLKLPCFTIPVVGFVDDVEFLLDKDAKAIHVRSASRLGESDLGVNRRRIETLRAKLSK